MEKIFLPRVNDLHFHGRSGQVLKDILPFTSEVCSHALFMPNIAGNEIVNARRVEEYRAEILKVCNPLFSSCEPLMTIMITPKTTPPTIEAAYNAGAVAAKIYPRGGTTNSENGIDDWDTHQLMAVLEKMEELGMVLCVHGELVYGAPEKIEVYGQYLGVLNEIEPSKREIRFCPIISKWCQLFPQLRIVFEHITTHAAVSLVFSLPKTVSATITVHHLLVTEVDVMGSHLNPHLFCKPTVKGYADMAALRAAAFSGNPKFFLGTDSAVHTKSRKEECGCAGVFSAPVFVEALIELFTEFGQLDKLPDFISNFGADFYDLPRASQTISYRREPSLVPGRIKESYVPFMAGKTLAWRRDE